MPEPPKCVCLGGSGLNVCSAVSYFSTLLGSIIGAGRLSFRVRDGSGRFPAAMDRRNSFFVVRLGCVLVVGCGDCGVVASFFPGGCV